MDVLGPLSWSSWIALSIVSALPFIYIFLTKTFNYWKKLGVSGPTPYPIVGTNLYRVLKPGPNVELDWFAKYGKLYGVFNKTAPIITIGEPELIKNVLVKDFHLFSDRKDRPVDHKILNQHLFASRGDDWKRLRSILSPTFTSGKMKKMYPMIRECLTDFLDHLEVYAKDGKDVNIKDMMGNFTMDVIATCAFATKTNSHKDPNNPFVGNAKKIFDFPISRLLPIMLLPKKLSTLLGLSVQDERLNEFFFDVTKQRINERKSVKNSKKYNDFIQLLVDANNNTN
ncbi:unnamed protein product, partial [Oppiella nova]